MNAANAAKKAVTNVLNYISQFTCQNPGQATQQPPAESSSEKAEASSVDVAGTPKKDDNDNDNNDDDDDSDSNNNSSDSSGQSSIPVKDQVTAKNGLQYQSNPKHTLGQPGNSPRAGIEPSNSLELFEQSVQSTKRPNQRYAYDIETGFLHRFFNDGNGTWHWSGSTEPGPNALSSSQIPIDIRRFFHLPGKGW